MDELALLATELVRALQIIGSTIISLPKPVLIAALLAPSLIALFSGSVLFFFSTLILNVGALWCFTSEPNAVDVRLLGGLAFLASLLFACHAFQERVRWRRMARVAADFDELNRQVLVFLEALDRRAQLVDKRANEAARHLEKLEAQRTGSRQLTPVRPGPDSAGEPSL